MMKLEKKARIYRKDRCGVYYFLSILAKAL